MNENRSDARDARDARDAATAASASVQLRDLFSHPSTGNAYTLAGVNSYVASVAASSSSIGKDRYESCDSIELRLENESEAVDARVYEPDDEMLEKQPTMATYMPSGNCATFRPGMHDLLLGVQATYRLHDTTADRNAEEKNGIGTGAYDPNGDRDAQRTQESPDADTSMRRFGMWDGVVARCLLQIWGVILFTRLAFIFGTAGIGFASLVVLISVVIVFLTALSLSAIITNGRVQGGGVYFLISRSLGGEFGAAIGLIFAFANAVAVALYLIGFAETLIDNVRVFNPSFDMDIRIIALIALVFILVLCLIGVDWVIKIQLGLLVLLCLAILSVIIGTAVAKDESKGVYGLSSGTLSDNFSPEWTGHTFFSVLAIFFPACTGIMAGVNISGEIKNPERSIPVGTLIAVGVSAVVYLLLGWMMASTGVRFVPGYPDVGLLQDKLIMTSMSLWPPLIYAGTYAATLSSAIASLVGAPRVMQALGADGIFEGRTMAFFSKTHGNKKEPWNGYFATAAVAAAFCLMGNLDQIATLITEFFMISYALINYACFNASHARLPSWRPQFKYYNKWVSLAASLMCIVIMFIIDWLMSLLTILVGFALFKYLEFRGVDSNFGDSRDAMRYLKARKNLMLLNRTSDHIKTFRPSFLVLTSQPIVSDVDRLVQFFQHSKGVLIRGHVIVEPRHNDLLSTELRSALVVQQMYSRGYLTGKMSREQGADANRDANGADGSFHDAVVASSFREGTKSLLQLGGIGKMRPNVLVLGFFADWTEAEGEKVVEYVNVIRDSFYWRKGAMVVRNAGKMNFSTLTFRGTVDVYWLYDDGGLSLLLSHILVMHKRWRHAKLRLFSINSGRLTSDQVRMANMLVQFRIVAKVVHVDMDMDARHTAKPSGAALKHRSELLQRFFSHNSLGDDVAGESKSEFVSRERADQSHHMSMPELSNRTKWQLAVSDIIREHSRDAELIIVTLAVPNVSLSEVDFMSWLTVTSEDMGPIVWIRGNQENVFSFI